MGDYNFGRKKYNETISSYHKIVGQKADVPGCVYYKIGLGYVFLGERNVDPIDYYMDKAIEQTIQKGEAETNW